MFARAHFQATYERVARLAGRSAATPLDLLNSHAAAARCLKSVLLQPFQGQKQVAGGGRVFKFSPGLFRPRESPTATEPKGAPPLR